MEADLAKAFLESNNIKVMISEVFSAVPPLESAMGLRLLVKEEDTEKATELLKNEAGS